MKQSAEMHKCLEYKLKLSSKYETEISNFELIVSKHDFRNSCHASNSELNYIRMGRIDNDLPMAQTRLVLEENLLDDIRDGQYAIKDREMDIIVHIGHAILLLSALVVMRTGVEFEHLIESL